MDFLLDVLNLSIEDCLEQSHFIVYVTKSSHIPYFTWAFQTYHTESVSHNFVYDVEKSLYTLEGLLQNKHEFTIMLDDITLTTSNRTTANGSSGTGVGSPDEVLSVLDIILKQHASRKSCLLFGQSGLYGNFKNFTDPGGGVLECRAFHSIFITVQDGLSLNVGEVDSKKFYRDLSFLPFPLSIVDFFALNSDGTNVHVAYQGVPRAYSEAAALKVYPECEVIPYNQFEAVFKADELWLVDKAVLAIENNLGGSIHRNYDLLFRHRLYIVGEALAQSEMYPSKLGVVRECAGDIAGAAQFAALLVLEQ
ncbi:hypothetical protein GIB67_039963 [Kingdonia uniflora]|uniref:Prephenate dehydratase domain-containing protein n=1 Tax=Kingdonia uniflora TaxID=39325 RepID=A0A7J7P424_9MAGN|nr:hypothetical protein GIB67_039963 [Kingdonia uniflora]